MDAWCVLGCIMAFVAGLIASPWWHRRSAQNELQMMNRRYAAILMSQGSAVPWFGGEDIRDGDMVTRVEVYVRRFKV